MPAHSSDSRTAVSLTAESVATDAVSSVVTLVYEELRRIAQRQLRAERADHTLSTSALVNEAYLKLAAQTRAAWNDHAHFLAVAAQAMRRILVDYARQHHASKRGGDRQRVTLDSGVIGPADERAESLIALDDALSRLAKLDPRQSRVVECRFFAGLSVDETARVLGLSPATVKRDWVAARAWLNRELQA
jgi:RNA polymerase sigma factor (TIGR02999 family)